MSTCSSDPIMLFSITSFLRKFHGSYWLTDPEEQHPSLSQLATELDDLRRFSLNSVCIMRLSEAIPSWETCWSNSSWHCSREFLCCLICARTSPFLPTQRYCGLGIQDVTTHGACAPHLHHQPSYRYQQLFPPREYGSSGLSSAIQLSPRITLRRPGAFMPYHSWVHLAWRVSRWFQTRNRPSSQSLGFFWASYHWSPSLFIRQDSAGTPCPP